MTKQPQVEIYTDGACSGNPGPGGWGVLLRYGRHEKKLSGGEKETTNNRMELMAAIQAFQALKEPCRVDLYTDSEYLKKGITEWMDDWKALGWRRGKPGKTRKLANADLWKALDRAVQEHQVTWHWIQAHAGDEKNERADKLARQAIPS
jgi:ribonuclease HI